MQYNSFFLETYGCQMNVYDSELVRSLLIQTGLRETTDWKSADIAFLNTCSIREHAESKVHSRLGNLYAAKRQKPWMLIGVLGCMAQNLKEELLQNKPYVDIILGPDSYRKIPEYLQRHQSQNHIVDTQLSKYEVYEGLFPSREFGTNAWIAISRGCDKFCTFCIVPFTRGRERSRSLESIVKEAKQAVDAGFVEITLLGQNVNSYRSEKVAFPDLLQEVAKVDGIQRIRFTSPHPSDCDDQLIEVIASNPKICNSIHLPLQSGSNRILSRMNRSYSKEEFTRLVEKFRNAMPDIGISTDIIVGFPGETDAEFQETLDVMKAVKFDSAFTFKYSARPGTKASEYTEQLTEAEKGERLERVIQLQKAHTLSQNQKMIGKTVQVLVEKASKKSEFQLMGRTDNNKIVVFDRHHFKSKDMIVLHINDAYGMTLFGDIPEKEKICD